MVILLRVRQSSTSTWIQNFSRYGWKIFHEGEWLQMTTYNTKIRSADGSEWLDVK